MRTLNPKLTKRKVLPLDSETVSEKVNNGSEEKTTETEKEKEEMGNLNSFGIVKEVGIIGGLRE